MRNDGLSEFKLEHQALVFAALGDATRLALVSKLSKRKPHSIASLTAGTKLSRQAVTKHLNVLESVGLVSKLKDGRESLYTLQPKPLHATQKALERIATQWEQSLRDLKAFVEST